MLSMTQKTPSPELSKEVGTLCFGAVSAKGAGWLQHIERPMDVKSQTRTQRMSLKSFCKEEWAKPTTKDVLLLCFCQQGLFDQVLRHVLLVDQIFISLSDMQISLLFLCNVLNTGFLMDILYIIYVYYIYIYYNIQCYIEIRDCSFLCKCENLQIQQVSNNYFPHHIPQMGIIPRYPR